MNIKYYILFFLFTATFATTKGQIIGPNLVQNPSFEQYETCPDNLAQLYKSKYWWGISTDFYNICNTGNVSIPLNFGGFQNAKTGVAYAAFLLHYHSFNITNKVYMETIKKVLSDSLKKNKRYCINYYLSLAEYTFIYINQPNVIVIYDSIGVLFSVNPVKDTTSTIICDTCAIFTKSVVGIDTTNWFKISGSIIAHGGEKYLTIGKFSIMNWVPNIFGQFYVYIDDVSVCECSFDIDLGQDTTLCKGNTIILKPNLPNAIYTWQDSSHAATYEVKHSGTYWVRAYIAEYDITTSDTIVISYSDCNITEFYIPNSFSPNGDGINDKFEYGNASFFDIKTYIYNRWGQLIYEGENTDYWDGSYKGKPVQMDVYNYRIEATDKASKERKMYNGRVTVVK
jgi:gliding motility-associated-like protein